jgi:hypothetical protein
VSERGWQRKFEDPIPLPDGTRLNTLREAVAYLAKTVPKSERRCRRSGYRLSNGMYSW